MFELKKLAVALGLTAAAAASKAGSSVVKLSMVVRWVLMTGSSGTWLVVDCSTISDS